MSTRVRRRRCTISRHRLSQGGPPVRRLVPFADDDADVAATTVTTTSRRHEMLLAARRIRWMCLLCACALADQRVVNTARNDTQTGSSTSVRSPLFPFSLCPSAVSPFIAPTGVDNVAQRCAFDAPNVRVSLRRPVANTRPVLAV